jgi:ATP:ADP antiporter, AAA family
MKLRASVRIACVRPALSSRGAMNQPASPTPQSLHGRLRRLVDAGRDELPALAWSFVFFFCVLCAYYILRPVRDAMGVTVGAERQKWLFSIVFLVMLAAVPVFGWVVSRYPKRNVVPIVYVFFILNLLVFWLLIGSAGTSPFIAGAFFVWVSVFVLFVVSLFWSFMADHFTSDQAKRLYGVISAGGSLGALTGSSLTGALVHRVGVPKLLLLSALVLTGGLAAALVLRRLLSPAGGGQAESKATGHGILAGARHAWNDPYLFRIALWVLLANLVGTYFYIEEQRIIGAVYSSKADQVAYFSSRDRMVSLLQIGAQFFVTGALLRRFGIGWCAAALPAMAIAGLVALAIAPTLWVIWAVMVAERAVAFGISNPAARVLWTVTEPEDKYKTQNFIDTVVYRGGDAASAWAVNGLTRSLGMPLAGVAMLMLPFAAVWLALTFQLSRQHGERAGDMPKS